MVSGLSPMIAHIMVTGDFMVVNFRACEISRGARKLIRILTLIIIKKKIDNSILLKLFFFCKDDNELLTS